MPEACPRPDPLRPLALVAPGAGGPRIVTLNRAARQSGLRAGDLVSNARSKVLDLATREADPAAVLVDDGADVVQLFRGVGRALEPGDGILRQRLR